MACENCKTTYFKDKGCGEIVYKDNKPYCCPCALHCKPVAEIKWVRNE
jgi:hypothetical protein